MLAGLLALCALQAPPPSAVRQQYVAPAGKLEDVAYGPNAHQLFDLYYPVHVPPPYRVALYLHGGGFTDGDKSIDPNSALFAELLRRGFAVASANYGLAPAHTFPGPVYDAGRCVQFLRSEHAWLGVDPERVAVIGRSAGAALGLWIAYASDLKSPGAIDPVQRLSSRPQVIVNMSGTTDFTQLAPSVSGAFFGASSMGGVPNWKKSAASARQWVLDPQTPTIATLSVYKGPITPPPQLDPHAAQFGVLLHAALDAQATPQCKLEWNPDPTAAMPDVAIADWIDASLP